MELLNKFGIKDSEYPDFVRVEVTPIDGDIFNHKLKNWQFKTDQDLLPDWYTEKDAERAVKKVLPNVWKSLFVTKGVIEITKSRLFAGGSATVKAWGSATVKARGSATVKAWGSVDVIRYGGKVTLKEDAKMIDRG